MKSVLFEFVSMQMMIEVCNKGNTYRLIKLHIPCLINCPFNFKLYMPSFDCSSYLVQSPYTRDKTNIIGVFFCISM